MPDMDCSLEEERVPGEVEAGTRVGENRVVTGKGPSQALAQRMARSGPDAGGVIGAWGGLGGTLDEREEGACWLTDSNSHLRLPSRWWHSVWKSCASSRPSLRNPAPLAVNQWTGLAGLARLCAAVGTCVPRPASGWSCSLPNRLRNTVSQQRRLLKITYEGQSCCERGFEEVDRRNLPRSSHDGGVVTGFPMLEYELRISAAS